MALTQSEIYTLAKQAGLSPARAKVASAIGMAESAGDPNAHNPVPPDDSWGVWQINMIGALGASRRAEFGIKDNSELSNPVVNARAMSSISKQGANFNPWSTYTNKSYLKWMNNAVADQSKKPGFFDNIAEWMKNLPGKAEASVPGVSEAVAVADGVSQLAQVVTKSAVWVSNPQNWIRVAFVSAGSIVAIAGIVMIMRSTSAGRAVESTATKVVGTVTPTGRAASAVKKVAS